jgi:hypothetical protein
MCWRRGNRVRKKSEGIQRWILLQEKKPSHIDWACRSCIVRHPGIDVGTA